MRALASRTRTTLAVRIKILNKVGMQWSVTETRKTMKTKEDVQSMQKSVTKSQTRRKNVEGTMK